MDALIAGGGIGARTHMRVHSQQPPRQRQQYRHDVVRHFGDAEVGRIGDDDPVRTCGIDGNFIDAVAQARDQAAVCEAIDDSGR